MPPRNNCGGQASPASDQYSLGILFYELLAGCRPFDGAWIEFYRLLHTEQIPASLRTLRPDLPRDLETIVLKCLEKEEARRYPNCQALADDLRRWQEGQPVTARRPGLPNAWHVGPGETPVARRVECGRDADTDPGDGGLRDTGPKMPHQAKTARQAAAEARWQKDTAEQQAVEARKDYDLAFDSLNQMVFNLQEHLRKRPGTLTLRRNPNDCSGADKKAC
jgi:serine/threonine protein kinase